MSNILREHLEKNNGKPDETFYELLKDVKGSAGNLLEEARIISKDDMYNDLVSEDDFAMAISMAMGNMIEIAETHPDELAAFAKAVAFLTIAKLRRI